MPSVSALLISVRQSFLASRWVIISFGLLCSHLGFPQVASGTEAQTGDRSLIAQSDDPLELPPQDITPLVPEPLPLPELAPSDPATIDDVPPLLIQPDDIDAELSTETFVVEEFLFTGNTQFSDADLAAIVAEFIGRDIRYLDLIEATNQVTQFYIDNGYITSGAIIPSQVFVEGQVTIQVVEGQVESINISGTERLNPSYVRSRLALGTDAPLDQQQLLNQLRLLQTDPLIESFEAQLTPGLEFGTNVLDVVVNEADSFGIDVTTVNDRSPSIGSLRNGIMLREANLLGMGDGLSLGYSNTDGSNSVDLSYSIPLNPRNGELSFRFGASSNDIVEPPFDDLGIESSSQYYDLTFRQPLSQTSRQEFAIGATLSHYRSQSLVNDEPFPNLSPGLDEDGRVRVSALRFFQDWTTRSEREVFAVRSQFNLGLDLFDATTSSNGPDSRFLSWQGQAQWVRLLAPDTLLYLRGNVQFADQDLLPVEQFSVGGFRSVRGYRQDVLLGDNGAFASAEVQLPVLRISDWDAVVQLCPFVDFGTVWSSRGETPDPSSLTSIGLGLQWQQPGITARLDWGIPLTSIDSSDRTWQEQGLLFSITVTPF